MRLLPIINYEAAKTAKKVGIWRLLHRLNDLDDCPLMRMHCKQLIEPHTLDCHTGEQESGVPRFDSQ